MYLGCGTGVFIQALASILPANSTIYAVDKSFQTIRYKSNEGVLIRFVQADFEHEDLSLPHLDGIIMANSLHYVSDKKSFLNKLKRYFSEDRGSFIIVEYDTMRGNPWVPYPIDFHNLKALVDELGFQSVSKIGERKSIYGHGKMYASHILI